jgi:hypothetical protein
VEEEDKRGKIKMEMRRKKGEKAYFVINATNLATRPILE